MTPTLADITSAKSLAQSFITFLHASPSPYHAVKNLTSLTSTLNHPITHLTLTSEWKLHPGNIYTLCKGGFMATFHIGKDFKPDKCSFNIIASHTDSPCLKLTYNHSSLEKGLYLASVQCYGGGLWNTWVDRGLGFAGRVTVKSANTTSKTTILEERLINVSKPVFYIPNLAIHLRTRDEMSNFSLDLEKHLKPIVSTQLFKSSIDDDCPPLISFIAKELGVKHDDILNFDLFLVDTHPPELGGIYDEFINSGRLDNLTSCYITLKAFIETLNAKNENTTVECLDGCITVVLHYNYEEVGSQAGEGAFSSTTVNFLKRILLNLDCNEQMIMPIFTRSFVTSVDMAHAVHPLFPERHQKEHQPQLQNGIVIKSNPLLRYATDIKSSCIMELLAENAGIPIQHYRVPNTSPCGSTIGPFLSSKLGCDTADIGICQFAMHSIREFCGILDLQYLLHFTKAIITHLPDIHTSYTSA
ncbi:aminopeptidase [Babesia microti strain RI]|uniref:aspartyl aminopeptidase n=1 Tax=Babesia microti (strain RI) TaxID=1133968 RepID=A0A1R4ABQ5_BABMR|nr:aminopeptidase [Babesia microti strain RI]SJK86374.1 aminopeptidase [Babesia microti strain RI]|eukprot:XP_021338536.1 aminopeptidase [Babesia microti strain RI]